MKQVVSLLLALLLCAGILTGCSSSDDNLEQKQGVLSGIAEQYIIYIYDSEDPVLLEKDALLDEELDPVNPKDVFLGLPVTLRFRDGELVDACADMKTWENIRPTGYPNGFVQRPCLYYRGNIYYSSFENAVATLPSGFQQVFSIQVNSGCDLPEQEGEACHVDFGTHVYASDSLPDCVYIDYEQGYRRFEWES